MIFEGTNKQFAELKIMGFESGKEHWMRVDDDDWLKIFINVKSTTCWWQAIDPSLTVGEFKMLIKWLKDLATPWPPASNPLLFMEPVLSFHHLLTRESSKTIKIEFDWELKPTWMEKDMECFLICRLNDDELKQLASDLEKELSKVMPSYEINC